MKNKIFKIVIIIILIILTFNIVKYFSIINASKKWAKECEIENDIGSKIFISNLIERDLLSKIYVSQNKIRNSYVKINENGKYKICWNSNQYENQTNLLKSVSYNNEDIEVDYENQIINLTASKWLENSRPLKLNVETARYTTYMTYLGKEYDILKIINNDHYTEEWKIYVTYDSKNDVQSNVELLGNPLSSQYTSNRIYSRNIWDMQLYNNRIYIGGGDYNDNTGPVPIYYYGILNNKFGQEGTVNDEQINRYMIINNNLIITGTDPKDSWEFGNYYIWYNNKWVKKRVIPNGVHCFDMIESNGSVFVALGTKSGTHIALSLDGGNTFSLIPMYKNNEKIDTFRVYELFKLNDKIYGISQDREVYLYNSDTNIFEYIKTNIMNVFSNNMISTGGVLISKKINFKDNMIFANGELSITKNLMDYTNFKPCQDAFAYDVLERDGVLYVLFDYPLNDSYIISVYKTENLEEWEEILYFSSDTYARSFEYDGLYFYFGLGSNRDNLKESTGNILRVEL